MATAGNWWELPMPPGWERKFDPGNNRYFYLNHSTHSTQWEDPRVQLFKQLQASRGQQQAQHQHYGGQAMQHYAQQQQPQHHAQQPQHQQYGVQQRTPQQQHHVAQQRTPQQQHHVPQHPSAQQQRTPQHLHTQHQQTPQQHHHSPQQQHIAQQRTPQHQQHTPQQSGHHVAHQAGAGAQGGQTFQEQLTPLIQGKPAYFPRESRETSPTPRMWGGFACAQNLEEPFSDELMYNPYQYTAGYQPHPVARQPSPTPQRSPQPTHVDYHNHAQHAGVTAAARARTPDRTHDHPRPGVQYPQQQSRLTPQAVNQGQRSPQAVSQGQRSPQAVSQAQRSPRSQPVAQSYGMRKSTNTSNMTVWQRGEHTQPQVTRLAVAGGRGIQLQEQLTQQESEESDDDETSFTHADPFEVNKLHGMFPTAPETLIKKILVKHDNNHSRAVNDLKQCGYQLSTESSQRNTNVVWTAIVKRLKQSFPSADQEVIGDVLTQCGQDEQKARRQLANLGYSAAGGGTRSSQRDRSPAPVAQTPKISESDKTRLRERFHSEFKSHPHSIIEMALEASEYDETKTRVLLQSMESPEERRRERTTGGRSHTESPSRVTTSTDSSTRPAPASVSGVVVNISTPDSSSRPSTSSTISTPSRPSSSAQRQSPARKPREQRQQPKAKRERAAPRERTSTRTTQPSSRPAYVSSLRTKPKGPDRSLVQGPQKDHLLTDYVQTQGHKSDLAKGPDPGNLQGKDLSLRQGPLAENREGPNPLLVNGTTHNRNE